MSKYTVELRWLMETGYDLDMLTYPIFDEAYRTALNNKILAHYKFQEIGFETPALFKHYLNTTLGEIMPLYNKMYASELIVFDPMKAHDLAESYTKDITGSGINDTTGTVDTTVNTDDIVTNAATQTDDLFSVESDTPQGLISATNIKGNLYASKAARGDNLISNDSTVTTDGAQVTATEGITHGTNSITNLEEYTRTLTGNAGAKNYSELLQDFRSTFLNIDMMVIRDLATCFMGIY